MLNALKSDLGIADIPIVIGELGYFFYPKAPFAEDMNGVIREIAASNDCIGLVTAEGLNHKGDDTHFDSDSYHALGIRYAAEMLKVQTNCTTIYK